MNASCVHGTFTINNPLVVREHSVGAHSLNDTQISAATRGQNLAVAYLTAAFGDYVLGNGNAAIITFDKATPVANAQLIYQFNLALALNHARRGNYDVATRILRSGNERERATYARLLYAYCEQFDVDTYHATSLAAFLAGEPWGGNLTLTFYWLEIAVAAAQHFDANPESIFACVMGLSARHSTHA